MICTREVRGLKRTQMFPNFAYFCTLAAEKSRKNYLPNFIKVIYHQTFGSAGFRENELVAEGSEPTTCPS